MIYLIIVKLEFIIKRNSLFDFLDASFSERINGLKVDVKSVNNRKTRFFISLSFVLVSSIKYSK